MDSVIKAKRVKREQPDIARIDDAPRLAHTTPDARMRALAALAEGGGLELPAIRAMRPIDLLNEDERIVFAHGSKNVYRDRQAVIDQEFWPVVLAYVNAANVHPLGLLFPLGEYHTRALFRETCEALRGSTCRSRRATRRTRRGTASRSGICRRATTRLSSRRIWGTPTCRRSSATTRSIGRRRPRFAAPRARVSSRLLCPAKAPHEFPHEDRFGAPAVARAARQDVEGTTVRRGGGTRAGIAPGGFEPPFSDPKSDVLPLDEGAANAQTYSRRSVDSSVEVSPIAAPDRCARACA